MKKPKKKDYENNTEVKAKIPQESKSKNYQDQEDSGFKVKFIKLIIPCPNTDFIFSQYFSFPLSSYYTSYISKTKILY